MNKPLLGIILFLGVAPAATVLASPEPWLMGEQLTEPVRAELPPYFTTVDVMGIPSKGARNTPDTTVLSIWVGPENRVIGIGWEVVLRTIAPSSWLADIAVHVTNSANQPFTGFALTPGGYDQFPGGPVSYNSGGLLSLDSLGVSNIEVGVDGFVRLEFFEFYVDLPGQIEGLWESGQLYFQTDNPIPPVVSPATVLILGAQGAVLLRRRR